jgi:hypothetical protein
MSNASELFEALRSFRTKPGEGKKSQQSLVEYCQSVLGKIERVHFDFKTKTNPSSLDLDDKDKKNLAKAISGFANGAGGVLIWGLEDSTVAPQPICEVSRFVDKILQLAPHVTGPTVPGIDGDFIPADGKSTDGFGLVLIPESDLPPHRVLLKLSGVQDHYYIRSGSSFTVASHSLLEDMFGRRPRPILRLGSKVEVENGQSGNTTMRITLALVNVGRGLARYPYLDVEVWRPYGLWEYGLFGNGGVGLPRFDTSETWISGHRTFWARCKFGSQEGIVIHSGVTHPVTGIFAELSPNHERGSRDLKIRFGIAAEGIPFHEEEQVLTESRLTEIACKKEFELL